MAGVIIDDVFIGESFNGSNCIEKFSITISQLLMHVILGLV